MPNKILLVDENETNLIIHTLLLEHWGYEVMSTHQWDDVFRLIELEKPDLILMGLLLPELSGIDLAWTIRQIESYQDIPVVALTAQGMLQEMEAFYGVGGDGYIVQPVAPDKLRNAIHQAFLLKAIKQLTRKSA